MSGDFYWFEEIGNLKFLAVVDCTGHGVPGAFMSIIGNTLLNEIINNKKTHAPNLILEQLHVGIVNTLNQQQNQYMQDGMDIALCCIEKQENDTFLVKFSGAKRPIYYFSDKKLMEIAGDKKSIGETKINTQFQQHIFTLSKNNTIYMQTDGTKDIANADRVRLGSSRFREKLAKVAYLPLQNQKEVIVTQIDNFQGDSEQRDDILVVGVKL